MSIASKPNRFFPKRPVSKGAQVEDRIEVMGIITDEQFAKAAQRTQSQKTTNQNPTISSMLIEEIKPDVRTIYNRLETLLPASPSVENEAGRAIERAQTIAANPDVRHLIMNTAATNTIATGLKRTVILQDVVRDFATRVLPLRLLSTVFSNIPLLGTDKIDVPYYPLETTASSDFTDGDGTGGTGYVFGQATTTNSVEITVNKRKYQPIDYSSRDFQFQPAFDAARLGKINAERLGVDILNDILSVVTNANFGAAAVTTSAVSMVSDSVIDLRAACNLASWPDVGRALIVDSSVDAALQKDSAYKLALNIGTNSVIQDGKFPNLSGFEYAWMPNLPTNGEKLIGFAAFASAILAAFAPVAPAPGVRQQLVSYQVATDAATGISLNYRHWGVAQADRDFEVIESCYGYQKGVSNAIKRIVAP